MRSFTTVRDVLLCTAILWFSCTLLSAQAPTCKPFNFNIAPSYQLGPNSYTYSTGDYNNDRNVDMAVVNGDVRSVSILFGDGAGGFGPPSTFPTVLNPYSLTSLDLNHDGALDLVAASFLENKFAFLINDGTGSFLAPSIYVPPNPFPNQGQYYELKSGDFNGDGFADVVAVQNQTGKQLKFFIGNDQGGLTYVSTLTLVGNDATA